MTIKDKRKKKNEYQREWVKNNPEKRKEHNKKHKEKNKENLIIYNKLYRENNKEKIKRKNKKYREENKEKLNNASKKAARLKRIRKFGLTLLDYYTGRSLGCQICGCEFTGDRGKAGFCMDHCHKSGNFRGFICKKCNSLLGYAKDDEQILNKAIRYLQDSHRR